jgi:uncharacterized membrane protein YbaN (DUF454 family)
MVEQVKQSLGKVISFALVLCFVALGVVGILLPILPGLLFLFIAARHFPPLAFLLKSNRYSRSAMRYSDGFMDLDWWGKTSLAFWATIKITLDGIDYAIDVLGRVFNSLRKRGER